MYLSSSFSPLNPVSLLIKSSGVPLYDGHLLPPLFDRYLFPRSVEPF